MTFNRQRSANAGFRLYRSSDAYRGGVALFEITLLKRYRIGLVAGALWTTALAQEFARRAAEFADRLLLPSAAEHHVSLR